MRRASLLIIFLVTTLVSFDSFVVAEPSHIFNDTSSLYGYTYTTEPVQVEDEVGDIEGSSEGCPTAVKSTQDHNFTTLSFFDQSLNLGQYIPESLVEVESKYTTDGRTLCLRRDTYDAFTAMTTALEKEVQNGTLFIRSGFRTQTLQKSVKLKRGIYAAAPGRSEHQLGNAIDVIGTDQNQKFIDSIEYTWMKEHAYEYGFVESYQSEHVDTNHVPAEAWHWRYIGIDLATRIHQSDLDPNEFLYSLLMKQEWENISSPVSPVDIMAFRPTNRFSTL